MTTIRGYDFPDDLFFMVEHDIWARPEADGVLTIGLTPLGCRVSGEFIEFMPKPLGTQVERDRALAAYHHYEVASASVQIAIVMASAAIITGMSLLIWVAIGLGIVGVAFCGIGFFAPLAVHLF